MLNKLKEIQNYCNETKECNVCEIKEFCDLNFTYDMELIAIEKSG